MQSHQLDASLQEFLHSNRSQVEIKRTGVLFIVPPASVQGERGQSSCSSPGPCLRMELFTNHHQQNKIGLESLGTGGKNNNNKPNQKKTQIKQTKPHYHL